MRIFMRFPEGKKKALTLSYDDGVESDIGLIEIMKQNGLLGTFNINSGVFAAEGTVYPKGTISRRMSRSQIISAYKDSGMEVAVHSFTHPYLEHLPTSLCNYEIMRDRLELEEMFGGIIRGMAYPFGTFSDGVIEVLKSCGIAYARTTVSTEKFDLPRDVYRLNPTCHHNNPRLGELTDKFLASEFKKIPGLFYLWGHSYEFDRDNNWNVIEEFARRVGGHADIWYATNIDIIDYTEAYKSLIFSADGKCVYNPTATTVWLEAEGVAYRIASGEKIVAK